MNNDVLLARTKIICDSNNYPEKSNDNPSITTSTSSSSSPKKIDNPPIEGTSSSLNSKSLTSSTSTPSRKVSTSKFGISFANFYTSSNNQDQEQQQKDSETTKVRNNEESYPEIKGKVESKLMSMWHNVKYGKLSVCW